jgi:hypothetical protein
MSPTNKDKPEADPIEGPTIEQEDWEAIEGGELVSESAPDNGDLRYEPENQSGEHPEEDDDNPYQESDEALPEEKEEKLLNRDPGKEGTRFDEIPKR